jgi:hypothetical protein
MTSQTGQQSQYQQEAGTFLTIIGEMAPELGLDYTVESLQRLDQFIAEHFDPPNSKHVGETLPVGIGCYVGEVIIRNLGGHWNADGQPEINDIGPVQSIFPIDKAIKRFQNGREDSLAWYYHTIAKHAYEAGMAVPQPQLTVTGGSRPGKPGGFMGFLQGFFKK